MHTHGIFFFFFFFFGVIKLILKLIIGPKTPKKPLADDGSADSSSQIGIFSTLFFTYSE